MDTLSTSVSTIKVPVFYSTHRHFHHFKAPSAPQQLPSHSHFTTKPNSISHRTALQTSSLKTLANSYQTSLLNLSPSTHQNPASGYAAALIDVAQRSNSLETVQKDAQRLLKLLQNEEIQSILIDPFVGEKQKAAVVKETGKMAKINRLLARLLNMLVQRNKVMMVNEVLIEFQRIFDELSGTKVVLVSSEKKMDKDELFGIAQRVQKVSGAMKVKVRNLIEEKLPSFSM